MNEESHSDLFELRLNENGIRYIRKFAILTKLIVVAGVISSAIIFIITLGRIFFDVFDYASAGLDSWQTLYFKLSPFFGFILTVFFLFQLYHYWKIKQHLENAIETRNEMLFNESFHSLLKNAGWGLTLAVASLVVSLFDLLFFARYY